LNIPLTHLITGVEPNTATRADCLAMAKELIAKQEISPDILTGNINFARVTMLQLFVHMTINTRDVPGGTGRENLYSGHLKDGFGVYPETGRDHPVIDKATGKFDVDEKTGLLHWYSGSGKIRFMVGDVHRVTEHFFLASAHFFAHRLHNKLLDDGVAVDYVDAKRKTLACLARIFLDIWKDHTQQLSDSVIAVDAKRLKAELSRRNRELGLVINTHEVVTAFMRWAHTLVQSNEMSEGLNHPIFDRDEQIVKMFNWNLLTAELDLAMPSVPQVSPAMTEMNHTGGEPDVRLLTMTRFCEQGLNSWDDIAGYLNVDFDTVDKPTPTWLGVLQESNGGQPGLITTRILNACFYEALWKDNLLDDNVGDHINDSLQTVMEYMTT